MNVVLEDPKAVPYFTDLKETLDAANIKATDFDWFLSDLETNYTSELLPPSCGWLTGEELASVLERPGLQFIWLVASAFPKAMRIEVPEEPCADGNSKYWNNTDLKPQLLGALFEIVSWDSSATLLIGVSEESATAYMRRFPQAKPHAAVKYGDA